MGGAPITDPNDWDRLANCKYIKPTDPSVRAIIQQGVEGEQCAIKVYKNLMEVTKDADPITYQMVLSILQDEVDHEEDFQSLLEDIEEMVDRR